jgi:hypothetical protein
MKRRPVTQAAIAGPQKVQNGGKQIDIENCVWDAWRVWH